MVWSTRLEEGDSVAVQTIMDNGLPVGVAELTPNELDDLAEAATAIAAALRAKPRVILPRHLDPGDTLTGPDTLTYTVIAAPNRQGGELRYALALNNVASTPLMARRDLADYANANGFQR